MDLIFMQQKRQIIVSSRTWPNLVIDSFTHQLIKKRTYGYHREDDQYYLIHSG